MVSTTLIDVMLLIPVAIICVTAGIGLALGSCIAHDKRKEKRIREMVCNDESWCNQNCKHYTYCFGIHGDPDEAWKELEDYCCQCPMARAIDEWEKSQEVKKRGKQ